MDPWVVIRYVFAGLFMVGIGLLSWRFIRRRSRYIFILFMDKGTHQPLANHQVLGMFNTKSHPRQYIGEITSQSVCSSIAKTGHYGKILGKTDENGFFKYCNRLKPLFAVGIKKPDREKFLVFDDLQPQGNGYARRPKLIWV